MSYVLKCWGRRHKSEEKDGNKKADEKYILNILNVNHISTN